MINPKKPDYNSKDLRLHRKYILVLCFVLIILKYGGVKLDNVSLLGTSFSFENDKAIFLGLWIILFYSIMKYYQFFRHESWAHVKDEYKEVRSRIYEPKFIALLSNAVHPRILEVLAKRKEGYYPHGPTYFHGKKVGLFSRRFTQPVTTIDTVGGDGIEVRNEPVDFQYNTFRHFFWQTLRANWHFVFHTPFFFEFLFPFILLTATIIYCGLTQWEGSLIEVLGN